MSDLVLEEQFVGEFSEPRVQVTRLTQVQPRDHPVEHQGVFLDHLHDTLPEAEGHAVGGGA